MEQIHTYIVVVYFLVSFFLTGFTLSKDDEYYNTFRSMTWYLAWVILLVFLSPLIYLLDWSITLGRNTAKYLDKVFQYRFYWIYCRAGFYDLSIDRLIELDKICFAKEYSHQNGLVHRHLIFVLNLIFRRNNYQRRQWHVVNGMIEEKLS